MNSIFIGLFFLITAYLNYHQIESRSLIKLPEIIENYHVPLIQGMDTPLDSYNELYQRNRRQANVRDLKSMQQFQEIIDKVKVKCTNELGVNPQVSAKTLLYEEHPTLEEKCLSACILRKMKLMDSNYKLNAEALTRIAGLISNDNPMVVSAALNTAHNCNSNAIKAQEPCEAAHQINQCIVGELKANKLKLFY